MHMQLKYPIPRSRSASAAWRSPSLGGRARLALIGVVCVLGLAGCFTDEGDLRNELKALTSNIKGKIAPIPVAAPYAPYAYGVSQKADPFGPVKTQLALKSALGSTQAPDTRRIREPLEAYSIDAMRYSGTIIKGGIVHALITLDGNLYTVRLGNYLGQNYGRVMKISEDEVLLREIAQDATGEWIERSASLLLQGN